MTKENINHPESGSNHSGTSGRLIASIFLNGLITAVEITGGILSNSLALISDAIHNMSDTLALVLAWLAHRVGKREPDLRKTFGYRRFEILSAFINASVLTGISLYLIYAAIIRFLHPEPVQSTLMLVIAVIGLFANLLSMLFLHRDSKHSLNVKAAYLHLLGDTLSSIAVVGGAVLIGYTGLWWIDPVLTLVISGVIIRQAWQILRESTDILMQAAPNHLDLKLIRNTVEQHEAICNIHHVHCWQLSDRQIHFEAHVETTRNMNLQECGVLIDDISRILKERFSIGHTTLQVEYQTCADQDMIRNKPL
jgi:cobalt-zinc-cadmium efflux system protein